MAMENSAGKDLMLKGIPVPVGMQQLARVFCHGHKP